MKLFCAACEKEVTDNIEVFENVDGVLIHCGGCSYPLVFVPYDEPGWFGNPLDERKPKDPVKTEVEERLCMGFSAPADNRGDGVGCAGEGCACSAGEETPLRSNLTFTNEDIDLMEKVLVSRLRRLDTSYDSTGTLLSKIHSIKGLRAC